MNIHQCCYFSTKLFVLKQIDQFSRFLRKSVLCKVRFLNLAKDFKSETRKPLINVHQWRYLYPKLFVLKLFVNFSPFFIFLTTPTHYGHRKLANSHSHNGHNGHFRLLWPLWLWLLANFLWP